MGESTRRFQAFPSQFFASDLEFIKDLDVLPTRFGKPGIRPGQFLAKRKSCLLHPGATVEKQVRIACEPIVAIGQFSSEAPAIAPCLRSPMKNEVRIIKAFKDLFTQAGKISRENRRRNKIFFHSRNTSLC